MFGLIHILETLGRISPLQIYIYIYFSRIFNINMPYINHAIKLNAKFAHYCMLDVIIHAH